MMMQDILMKGSTPVQNMRTEVNLNTRTLQVNLKTQITRTLQVNLKTKDMRTLKVNLKTRKWGSKGFRAKGGNVKDYKIVFI